ncbi:hypothetical protein MRX96_058412 [Rhipicephalus microplus]
MLGKLLEAKRSYVLGKWNRPAIGQAKEGRPWKIVENTRFQGHALFCHAVRALTNDNRSRWESKLFPIIGHRPLQHRFLNYSKELRRALFAFDSYHVDRARGIN